MSGPIWKLSDDVTAVTVTFPTHPPVAVKLNVAELTELQKNLGILRNNMKPAVSAAFEAGQRVEAITNPAWVAEPDAMLCNSLLHIRDPRYGWLHYWIPKSEAAKLAKALQAQVDAPPPTQGRAN
jgi:hypothetical protein